MFYVGVFFLFVCLVVFFFPNQHGIYIILMCLYICKIEIQKLLHGFGDGDFSKTEKGIYFVSAGSNCVFLVPFYFFQLNSHRSLS